MSPRRARVLRISVTDRCNLRCVYCMPEEGVPLLAPADLLTYEEIELVARAAMAAGVRRLRLTGGEPLARRGVPDLVAKLARLHPDDLAMTTNGLLLAESARALKDAGLRRVTVSLDTLRPERFERIARRPGLDLALAGLDAARLAGLEPVKVNVVVVRGLNDDEIEDFVRFGERRRLEVRFIELMPAPGLSPECKDLGAWRPALYVRGEEIRARIEAAFGPMAREEGAAGVADVFRLASGARVGLITAMSEPFCDGCERLRLSSDGRLKICLFDRGGVDVRKALREDGAGVEELTALVRKVLAEKAEWTRGDLAALMSDMPKVGG